MEVGLKIKKLRELKSLTQEYMAQQLNVSQSTYSRFEKDDSDLTISQLKQISKLLDVKFEELVDNEKNIIFNYSEGNQGTHHLDYIHNNNNSIFDKDFFEKHTKLYEDKISLLEEIIKMKDLEIERLKSK